MTKSSSHKQLKAESRTTEIGRAKPWCNLPVLCRTPRQSTGPIRKTKRLTKPLSLLPDMLL
ncbi:hypothetical protein BBOMB_1528 [Bifidobacterium bombi DSM 19703]|uniref:Uncharacterized protein n=1 Tax=Bifidobacterium bombi DSM 19703 TaxID=1341695 RepID=A0A086BNZ7_9BIFI|nr:hypothetical protein BBOMB_1528 [Bifidobacterium bombi DSM 19703]